MQKIIESLSNLLWHIRFTFADGARYKQLWKEEKNKYSYRQQSKHDNNFLDLQYRSMSSNYYNKR